jgi:hypothetical protein
MQVLRETDSPARRATLFDAQQAVNDAIRTVMQYADWPWMVDRYDIPLVNQYSTGTVSVAQGSTAVTGSGTSWTTGLAGRLFNQKILLQGDAEEKEIASINNNTSLTLRYPYNSTALTSLVNVGYNIFQDSYPVPAQPGRDLMLLNPQFQYSRLTKLDRYTFDDRTAFNRFQTGIRPQVYCENGIDTNSLSPTFGQTLYQLWPRVTTSQDIVLRFYRQFTPLANDSDTTTLPSEFEDVVIRIARYVVKRNFGIPGWMEDKQEAYSMLLQLREKTRQNTALDYAPGASLAPADDAYAIDTSLVTWPGQIS